MTGGFRREPDTQLGRQQRYEVGVRARVVGIGSSTPEAVSLFCACRRCRGAGHSRGLWIRWPNRHFKSSPGQASCRQE